MRDDFIYPRFNLPGIISDTDMEHLGRLYTREQIQPWITARMEEDRKENLWNWANQNFTNEDGSGWEMSPGEYAIFKTIVYRTDKWVEVITATQYGKTQTIARAILTRLVSYPGDILNVVPDQKRGGIMLKYIIEDTARNDFFATKLQGINIKENNLLMRLLTEHSKKKLTYQVIGDNDETFISSIEILTADAKHKNNAITTIMGFGGRTIIADESALVDDDIDSAIFRMLAGKGSDTFLCKVGNPFFRNHFLADWKSSDFKKIYIDYQIALAEGRYTEDFLNKAFMKPNAGVFYRCEFPEQGAIDAEGWMMLFTDDQIKMAMQEAPHFGEERMGCDPADEGINESVIVKRSAGYAEILFHQSGLDPMAFTGNIVLNADNIKGKRIYIDKVGVGAGVYSRVSEVNRVEKKGMTITGVNAGEVEGVGDEYYNKRAEMFWRVRQWISSGGKLQPNSLWYQLAKIPYRADSRGKIQIMPKQEMRKRGIPSPDVADALSLTFYDSSLVPKMSEEERFWYKKRANEERKKRLRGKELRFIGH